MNERSPVGSRLKGADFESSQFVVRPQKIFKPSIERQATDMTQKTEPTADMKAAYHSALANAGGNGAKLRKSLDEADVAGLAPQGEQSPVAVKQGGEFGESLLI